MNIEHRTSNVQHRIMYSVNFKKNTEQHAAQAPALHERIYSWKFDSAELVAGCGLLVLKSIKRSVINIQRSMLDVRCSTFNLFTVSASLTIKKPCHFGVVSYERFRVQRKSEPLILAIQSGCFTACCKFNV